jgi:large subunit ribosomal protein L25
LPEYLEVDLSELEPGDVVMLSDINLPEGVEIAALAGDDEDETMIANTSVIKESQGTGAAAAEEAAEAELEAITETPETDSEEEDDDDDDEESVDGDTER